MRLVLFDFDGTLVDSRSLILECHRIVFTAFGLPVPQHHRSLALIGRSLELVLQELAGADAPIADMIAAYGEALPRLREDVLFLERPFPGISRLLQDLSDDRDVELGIATGHVSRAVLPIIDTLGWRSFFSTIQTADKAPSKPHPGMLLQALAATGAKAQDAVFIGDTSFDMQMALAAGVRAVGVSWGYHSIHELRDAGAEAVVDNVVDLRGLLELTSPSGA